VLGPWLVKRPDVIFVYHPPLTIGLPATLLSRLWRVPFVYQIQDLWPETLSATGMVNNPRVLRWVGLFARWVYSGAASILVISPGFKRNLIGKGVPADKICVIPNWADEDVYRPVPCDAAFASEHGLAGRFNVVYGGNLGAAQAMDSVLAAAFMLRDLPQVQFVLIGDGVDEVRLREAAESQGLDNVRFLGRQPVERMPNHFALADVLLVHLKDDPLFEITIPSKTIAYLACGRPILSAVAGDAADVVRDAGAGLICPPEDPAALAAAVRQFYGMPVEQREAMGAAGRRAFLANYSRAVLVDRHAALLTDVATRHKSSWSIKHG
jgi:colanic acid biosynthesis glycosyl transferase WcaI